VQLLVLSGLYFLKCTKFDQLFLRKIIKVVAARCQILTLKCTKIDFSSGGAYSAPPDPLAGFKEPPSKGRGGKGKGSLGWEVGRGEKGKGGGGREGGGSGGTGGLEPPPFVKS